MTPSYLREVIANGTTASSRRFALVVAVLCLGVSTVVLAVAACLGQEVSAALAAVTVPLAGMAGYSYAAGPSKAGLTSAE
jgi:hypothetical protein